MTVSKKYKNSNITTLKKLFQDVTSQGREESGTQQVGTSQGRGAGYTSTNKIVGPTNKNKPRAGHKQSLVKLIDTSKLLTQ